MNKFSAPLNESLNFWQKHTKEKATPKIFPFFILFSSTLLEQNKEVGFGLMINGAKNKIRLTIGWSASSTTCRKTYFFIESKNQIWNTRVWIDPKEQYNFLRTQAIGAEKIPKRKGKKKTHQVTRKGWLSRCLNEQRKWTNKENREPGFWQKIKIKQLRRKSIKSRTKQEKKNQFGEERKGTFWKCKRRNRVKSTNPVKRLKKDGKRWGIGRSGSHLNSSTPLYSRTFFYFLSLSSGAERQQWVICGWGYLVYRVERDTCTRW